MSEARRRLRTAITRLAEIDLVHGSPDAALATAQRIVADTPDDERARRVIIRAHLDTGELDEAKREYDRLTASLGETGRTPSDETMMVVRSVGLDR